MDFIDLKTQQQRIKATLDTNIQKVLAHGQYVMGPEVRELEERLAAYVGVKHAISCASGTDALLMALMAFGVGPGDAIFTSPFTFVATAEVISLLGATPVFVDIDPQTYNMDPAKLEQAIQAVEANDPAIHPLPHMPGASPLRPRGIIPVDLFGLPADYDAIEKIARDHGLFVVEDAAQSFGGEYKGKKACSFGNIACTSFFPAKPLGCYGDGGMCFTNDDALATLLDSIRVHGQGANKYENVRIGINGRMDTMQAAILQAKFDIFPEEIALRQSVAARYASLLSREIKGSDSLFSAREGVSVPVIPENCQSAWAQYSILARDERRRAALMEKLKAAGIPTAIYYPKPLHLQAAFAGLGYLPGAFQHSEDAARRIFSLPMHPYLSETDQKTIVDALEN